jgi:hypothetical protein
MLDTAQPDADREQIKNTVDNLLKTLSAKSFHQLSDYIDPTSEITDGNTIAIMILGRNYRDAVIQRWSGQGITVNFTSPDEAQVQIMLTYKPAPNRRKISNIVDFNFHYSKTYQKWFLSLK